MSFVEIDVFGVLISPFMPLMTLAFAITMVLRWVAVEFGWVRRIWHPACMGLFLSRRHHAISVVLCHSILLFDLRRKHSFVPTAYLHRRRAQRRSRTALLQRRRRLVLDGREHGGRLPTSVVGRARIRGEPAIGRDQTRTTLVFG